MRVVLYSATTDVALLRLPPMINLVATKLHVSANSGLRNYDIPKV